jgi:hypothetical protein
MEASMSDAAISVFVFGIYLLITGTGFILIPNVLLPLLKFPKTNEHWIRILGVVIFTIGFYYINAAQNELTVFFWATIVARIFVCLSFIILVITKKSPPMLAVFGLIELAGAIWTLLVS